MNYGVISMLYHHRWRIENQRGRSCGQNRIGAQCLRCCRNIDKLYFFVNEASLTDSACAFVLHNN